MPRPRPRAASVSAASGPGTDMSRSVKLAAAAAFGGLLIEDAAVSTTQPPARHDTTTYVADAPGSPNPQTAQLTRCSTTALPESRVPVGWASHRLIYFSRRHRQPEPRQASPPALYRGSPTTTP